MIESALGVILEAKKVAVHTAWSNYWAEFIFYCKQIKTYDIPRAEFWSGPMSERYKVVINAYAETITFVHQQPIAHALGDPVYEQVFSRDSAPIEMLREVIPHLQRAIHDELEQRIERIVLAETAVRNAVDPLAVEVTTNAD